MVLLIALLVDTSPKEKVGVWGTLQLKNHAHKPTTQLSNYQRIRSHNQEPASLLRYKERTTQENPFFAFYREEAQKVPPSFKQDLNKKQSIRESNAFFGFSNTDFPQEKVLYEAVLRESQVVQPGKAIRIFLQEPIELLQLQAGTMLKGIPHLEGNRVKIKVTAAVVDKQIRPIELICIDREDCLEGLYYDAWAAKAEESIKEGILEELWDIGEEQSEIISKGRKVGKRFSSLGLPPNSLVLESGKSLFVSFPSSSTSH